MREGRGGRACTLAGLMLVGLLKCLGGGVIAVGRFDGRVGYSTGWVYWVVGTVFRTSNQI
jgi:hypothetical protein